MEQLEASVGVLGEGSAMLYEVAAVEIEARTDRADGGEVDVAADLAIQPLGFGARGRPLLEVLMKASARPILDLAWTDSGK